MASWRKHFKIWEPENELKGNGRAAGTGSSAKFASWLQEVYTGQPNRVERYVQYDQMDQDSEINAALDTIAEFCTQAEPDTNLPFRVMWKDDPTESESKIVQESLKKWCAINKFCQRIFKTFRNSIQYGDHFFLRDPETFEWIYVEQKNVEKVTVDELKGKDPESYFIRDLDLN